MISHTVKFKKEETRRGTWTEDPNILDRQDTHNHILCIHAFLVQRKEHNVKYLTIEERKKKPIRRPAFSIDQKGVDDEI